MDFNMREYLSEKGWVSIQDNLFKKRFKTVKLIQSDKIMIAMNLNKKVKHKHIVTCKTPQDRFDAEMLFDLTWLND